MTADRRRMARFNLGPLEVIAGDSFNLAPVVALPSGRNIRPSLWVWQDMATRRILAWRVDGAGHPDLARASLCDLCVDHGIPDMAILDNGPGAAGLAVALGALGVEMRSNTDGRMHSIERAFAVLSQELGIDRVWRSWRDARRDVTAAVEAYNARRRAPGESPDDRWATEIDRAPARIPTPAQAAILADVEASS